MCLVGSFRKMTKRTWKPKAKIEIKKNDLHKR